MVHRLARIAPRLPTLTAATCAACALVIAIAWGCNGQGGGVLGDINSGDDETDFDPLALPLANQPTGPAADANRALHDWIGAALSVGAKIDLQKGESARTVIVDLTAAPALPNGAVIVWSFGDGVIRKGLPAAHAYPVAGTYPVVAAIIHPLAGPLQFDRVQAIVTDDGGVVSAPDTGGPTAVAVVDPIAGV